MPVWNRATLVLALTTLLGLCMALWGWSEVSTARGVAADYKARMEASQARLVAVQTNLRKVSSDYATQELRLRQLHSTLPDRATDDGVRKLLCERGRCAKLDPVPTPAD